MDSKRRAELAAHLKAQDDPYILPGHSGVLKNLLGLSESVALERAEAGLTMLRIDAIRANPVHPSFDLKHFRTIHRLIYQDIYKWAGKIRMIDISKNGCDFTPHQSIRSSFRAVHQHLVAENYLRDLSRDVFVEKLVRFFTEVNEIHPFRDGNGRAQEVFFVQLAEKAGYKIDWKSITKSEMDEAAIATFSGDREPMRRLFTKTVQVDAAPSNALIVERWQKAER